MVSPFVLPINGTAKSAVVDHEAQLLLGTGSWINNSHFVDHEIGVVSELPTDKTTHIAAYSDLQSRELVTRKHDSSESASSAVGPGSEHQNLGAHSRDDHAASSVADLVFPTADIGIPSKTASSTGEDGITDVPALEPDDGMKSIDESVDTAEHEIDGIAGSDEMSLGPEHPSFPAPISANHQGRLRLIDAILGGPQVDADESPMRRFLTSDTDPWTQFNIIEANDNPQSAE